MHSTASTIGLLVGNLFATLVLAIMWEKLVVRRFVANVVACRLFSVLLAWGTAVVTDGETITWATFAKYLIPAVAVWILSFSEGYGKGSDPALRHT